MVTSCVAYKCNNEKKKGSTDVSFHRFPKDEGLRKKWIAATKRRDFKPSNSSRLCSDHFASDAYKERPNAVYRTLKHDAVPTIFKFPWKQSPDTQKKPRRILVRNQIEPQNVGENSLLGQTRLLPQTQNENVDKEPSPKKCLLPTPSPSLQKKTGRIIVSNQLFGTLKTEPQKVVKNYSLPEAQTILSTILQTPRKSCDKELPPIQHSASSAYSTSGLHFLSCLSLTPQRDDISNVQESLTETTFHPEIEISLPTAPQKSCTLKVQTSPAETMLRRKIKILQQRLKRRDEKIKVLKKRLKMKKFMTVVTETKKL